MRGGSSDPSSEEVGGGGQEGVWRRRRAEEDDAGYQVDGEESVDEEVGEEDGRGGRGEGLKKEVAGGRCWVVFAVLFIFQLTLPSILWSYGILLSRMIEFDGVKLPVALWTPALFSATFCLADPWCRWPAMKGSAGKRRKAIATWMLRPMSVAGILLAAGSLAVTPYLSLRELHMVTYGVLAGIGASMAVAQSELALDQHFPPRRKKKRRRVLFLASIRVGRSLSQFIAPLLMLGIVDFYGRRNAPLMHSGFVLHALVAAALLRYRNTESANSRRNVRLRSMRYSIMEEDDGTEGDTGWQCGPHATPEGETLLPFEEDLAGRSWKNPAKDDTTVFDLKDDDDDIYNEETLESENVDTPPSLLQLPRRKNCYGVEILPQIPEETEEDESGDGRQSKRSSRRLTLTISNNNNNINNNNGKEPSTVETPPTGSNFPNGNYLPETPTSTSSTTFLITPNHGLRKWKRWKWRRRKGRRRRMKRSVQETEEDEEEVEEGKKGCCASLKEVIDLRGFCKASFYPALALSASSKLAGMVFFSLMPYVARRMGKTHNDSTLLVSLAGFSSLIVASLVPWISIPSPRTKVAGLFAPRSCKKFLYSFGSLVSSFSFFLLSRCDWNDRLTLASILFGIGSGAAADTTGSVLRVAYGGSEAIGGSQGLMNTISSFIILGFTALIGFFAIPTPIEETVEIHGLGVGPLSVCFSIVAITQFVAGIAWLVQPILSRFYRRQVHYADWNPGVFLQAT